MSDRSLGIGRGLAAILTSGAGGEDLVYLPTDSIVPNPSQPRRSFDPDALDALATSIKQRGVLQPVLVRPSTDGKYELIAGERRWRAAQIAGVGELPAVVRADDDAASLEVALVENMVREDLNPVEEAVACAALVDEFDLSHEEVGLKVGRSRAAVSNLIRLLELPDEVLRLIEAGTISEGHGRALLRLPDQSDRRTFARKVVSEGLSVRTLERLTADRSNSQGRVKVGSARPTRSVHPDEQVLLTTIEDRVSRALGVDVGVTASRSGYRLTLSLASLEELSSFADRLEQTG